MKLILGDSLDKLKELEENSVDSIVTDPPYGLSFMNKAWDYDVPQVELWVEAMRVLKPGGHLLSFAGSRTYHRMAVNIEDAGFEIRDQIMWVMGSGFPKSLNLYKQLQKQCKCGTMVAYEEQRAKQETERNLRPMQEADLQTEVTNIPPAREVLQSCVSEQSLHGAVQGEESEKGNENGKESSMEGGSDIQQGEGELQGSKVREVSEGVSANGEEGRVHNGTQASGGKTSQHDTNKNPSDTSHESRPSRQQAGEPCAFCQQHTTQVVRRWASELYGFGTALKPAHEPIAVARKPLSGKNILQNYIEHGTGGINIDGCRVESDGEKVDNRVGHSGFPVNEAESPRPLTTSTQGRFPANFLHDGSDEVVDKLGEPARFFYTAKASKAERNKGLEGFEKIHSSNTEDTPNPMRDERPDIKTANHHPTVKPIALMRYLVRLVTPTGGTVLDPYMGSGTTGIACKEEGFDFIGIEREEEYLEIAKARIA